MTPIHQTHPAPSQLHAFALGRLPPAELAEVEAHVATCPDCCAVLERVPDDTLLGKLRTGNTQMGAIGGETMLPRGGDTEGASQTVGNVEIPSELVGHPRYRILRRLGAGGMGVVYQAVHKLMEREVALKVINTSLTSNPVAVQRFHLEVKTAAKLQHPNIVTAHDAEQVGELHFLVMEYVDGISLDRLVEKNGPTPIDHACHIIRQAALGLQHAHEKGMVHRDVKPHNVMVTRKGQVKVLDFGLARLAHGGTTDTVAGKRNLTSFGVVLGTPDYIAPEQVNDSHAVDIRADIYSLGCTLYFLLTGQPPFPEGSSLQKALAHVDSYPTPAREIRPEVPAELLPILDRLMAKAPRDRYQTPMEVAHALSGFVRTGSVEMRRGATEAIPAAAMPTRPVPTRPASKPASAPAIHQPAPVAVPTPPPAPAPIATVEKAREDTPLPRKRGHSAERKPSRKRGRRRKRIVLLAGAVLLVLLAPLAAMGLRKLARGPVSNGLASLPRGTSGDGAQRAIAGKSGRGKVLVVLPAQFYWYPDYAGVKKALDEAGLQVVVCSSRAAATWPKPQGEGEPIRPDILLENVRPDDYDAVVFSSGHPLECADVPEAKDRARKLIDAMLAQDKLVGGLCHGTVILSRIGVLKGKRATGHPSRRWEIQRDGGATYSDQPVVVDGNVITGTDDRAAEEFGRTLVKELGRRGR